MISQECGVCKKIATQCCSNCNQIYYCSREHQKMDWRNHKSKCTPYKIEVNNLLGRHLIATRNIKAGDVIMKKSPLIIGPKTACLPLCLGCHKTISVINNIYRCSKCNWPMCDSICENSTLHQDECEIYSQMENVPNIEAENVKQLGYCLVLPLRVFLLKQNKTSRYELIENMESHLEENRRSPVYMMFRANLVPLIRRALKCEDIDKDEVLKICSIFDTNCFDVRNTDSTVNVRALYPDANLIAHDCKHNTKHNFHGDDFKIIVTATEDINKGDLLKTTYTQTLWGTLTRRSHLKRVKYFDCLCDRCKDPTEFGTYAGSIYCTECKLTIKHNSPKMISTNPLDPYAMWVCEKCDHTIDGKQIVSGNESIRKEILNMDKSNPRNLEEFLIKYEDLLHPSNYHVLEIKYVLTQLYGNIDGFKLLGTYLKKKKEHFLFANGISSYTTY